MPDVNYLLSWDDTGERFYETGVRRGVLFPFSTTTYGSGVSWSGLTKITESPSGAEETALYADDIKYLSLYSAEDFGFTIEAYTYPDEWAACDGSAEIATGVFAAQQSRKKFGLCYRTAVGNDVNGADHAYKLHLIYGATASPSSKDYSTINDSPEAITFSWECKTIPEAVSSAYKPTAHIVIDSRSADATKLAALEVILYGTPAAGQAEAVDARLPLPSEVISLMS